MKRIRLQVQIMPWQKPGSSLTSINTRQDAELKWAQPCTEDDTIQTLSDLILAKWARLCPGLGSLNIKYLTTFHGDLLDMEDTVGAIFDDRTDFPERLSSNEVLATSILQVHRYPPNPGELPRFQRLGSLMPESSARPKKRPYAASQQSPTDDQRTLSSIERPYDVRSNGISAAPNKRQRTREPHAYGSDWRMNPGEDLAEGNHPTSQTVGTQGSVHQVYDSQEPATQKQSNPYGTPTSLSLLSPQEPFLHNHNAVQSIPDSPTRRESVDLEALNGASAVINRETTKSESPEIPLSVRDVPDTHLGMNTAQTSDELEAPERLPSAQLPAVVSPPKAIMQEVDRLLEIHEHGNQEEFDFSSNANHTPSSQTHEPGSTFACRSESSKGSHRHSEQIYDEIESDTESFHERQKLHRPKRLKLDYTSRQRTSPHQNSHDLPVDRHDGPFLVPPIPTSGNRKSTPSGELEGSQQSQGAVSSKNSSEKLDAQHLDARNGSSLVPYLDSIRDVPMESNQPPEEVITNGEGDTGHEVQPKEMSSFQAIATCSQMPQKSTKNFKDLDEDHPIKVALSQTRKPDLSTMVNSGVRDGTQISKSIVQPRKSQRTAVESGKQKQGDERTEEPTEAQPAPDRTVDENTREETEERVDHRTEENSGQGKDEEIHSVEQTGPQQLEEAAQGTSKSLSDGTTGSAKEALPQPEQSRNNSENNKTPSGGRQSKESTLVEQAERMMLEKEGANQLQCEKVQKQQTPKVLQPHKSDAKVPSSTRNKPRTEEQKAARRERETKQRAEQRAVQSTKAKSVESKGNPNWAERLFRISGNDFRQSSEHIDTDSEKEENPKRQADTKSSASAIYNCKPIPDDLDARSSSPSGISRLGQNRKSLTPAVPNAAAFKPASSKGSLASSSPLASRSSVTSNTPLRSALKHNQTPSTIRRSVSFIDSEENNRSAPKPSNFPAFPPSVSRPFKSLVDLNNELALKEASLSEVTKIAGSDANHRKKATSKAVAEKDKVQQKLNVTRDKKLKGRAVEPPSPPKSQTKPAHDSSSIDEFLFPDSSSDEDFVHGNAKAGPSSRKKTPVAFRSQADFANKLLSRLTPTDPAIENTRAQEKTTDSPLPSRSSSISKASSQPKSISRSPALAVSESISLSSGSSSRSGSVSESGSSSASNIDPELQAESSRAKPSNSKKGDQPAIAERREDDRVGAQVPQTARQTSQVSKTASSSNGARKNDDEAGHQLRHENSQTMPAQAINAGPSSTNKGPHRPQESNRGLKGPLLDSTPTPYRYPTLTAQRRMAEGKPPVAIITPPMSSQKSAIQPPGGTSSSSSGSEDSSSSSEEEGEGRTGASPASSRTISKSKSRGFPGLRGVMKLAGFGGR